MRSTMNNLRFTLFISFLGCLYSQNLLMLQSVLSSGVVTMESEQAKLVGTVGQIFTKKILSQNMILESGFWGSIAQNTSVAGVNTTTIGSGNAHNILGSYLTVNSL